MHSILCKAGGGPSPSYKIGNFVFDSVTLTLQSNDGETVALRNQSARVLAELARADGQPVSRDDLIEAVWSGVAVTDDSLVQCIKDIRAALRDTERQLVRTLVGRGYAVVVASTPRETANSPRLFIEPFQIFGDDPICLLYTSPSPRDA